jgi:NADH-ubiquinone oxidoreductase chain 4
LGRAVRGARVCEQRAVVKAGTTDLTILLTTKFSEKIQVLLFLACFASFEIKVPMVPVHIWLPKAHVEAPTAGSVILAGILLFENSFSTP